MEVTWIKKKDSEQVYSPVSGRVAQVCVGGRGLEIGLAEERAF